MQQKSYVNNEQFIKYQFLAVSIASRYKNYNIIQSDLVQSAYLGLVIGLNKCSLEEEKHKINYLSKYILGEIISTLKSYNNYSYNKEYFKYQKILKENEDKSINEIINKYELKKEIVYDILLKDEYVEEVIDTKEYLLNDYQKKIYNLVVLRNYSITKTSKFLNKKRSIILKEVKEIYNIIKN
ncbi:MAG: hypothetical protein R3Y05_04660 [bacterium]